MEGGSAEPFGRHLTSRVVVHLTTTLDQAPHHSSGAVGEERHLPEPRHQVITHVGLPPSRQLTLEVGHYPPPESSCCAKARLTPEHDSGWRGYATRMLACPSCATQNEDGSAFCEECGTALAAPCPSCGTPATPDKRFCRICGTSLAAESALVVAPVLATQPVPDAPSPVPLAERRVCTVLFCDLVGFTTLSESRDPEDVRELLSEYFDVARTVIQRYGGTVEKFIGDAVMAVWGTPTATEQDAERGVRASLDVVDAVTQLGRERAIKGLAARAGLVTGPVAVTLERSDW